MGKNSFVVYIDESGDEGFVFKDNREGSSRWFVLSAVVTRKESDREIVQLVDRVRRELNKEPRKPLHFRNMKHEHRLPYVAEIAKAKLRILTVAIHKPSIQEAERFCERYRLYYYAVRLLLERISWFCRDHRLSEDSGDGTAEVLFSNRAGMSYQELRDYLRILQYQSESQDVRIDWDVIDINNITSHGHDQLMGLQIADAVASSFFFGLELTRQGFTEPRYVQLLNPKLYRKKTRVMGFGLKIWPKESFNLFSKESQLNWIAQFDQ